MDKMETKQILTVQYIETGLMPFGDLENNPFAGEVPEMSFTIADEVPGILFYT